MSIEKKIERPSPLRSLEYHVLIASWYGPTPGVGFSGSDIIEVDLEHKWFRASSRNYQTGISPDKPPNTAKDLRELIINVPSNELSQKDCQSLQEIIAAWLKTKPPAEYHKNPAIVSGETVIFVSWNSNTVTSIIDRHFDMPGPLYVDAKRNPPRELLDLMYRLSYLMTINKK